jgi:para-nitrobenzyl esterase
MSNPNREIMKKSLYCAAFNLALGLVLTSAALAQQPSIGHAEKLVVVSHPAKDSSKLTVTSPAFKDGADIPFENTQYRGNIFPGLNWSMGPKGTRSYAVIMQGEALKGTGTSIHLTLFNVPANVTKLDPGLSTPPSGALYGVNVHGVNQPYSGPHTHTLAKQRYHFQVLALDTVVAADPSLSLEALQAAMKGHVLASGDIMGLASQDPEAKEQ